MKLKEIVNNLSVLDRIEFKQDHYYNNNTLTLNSLIASIIFLIYGIMRLFYLIVKLYNPLLIINWDISLVWLFSLFYFVGSLIYYTYNYQKIKKEYSKRVIK